MPTSPSGTITLLSPLTPPSLERTWLTAPHPRLPFVATCSADKTVRIYSLQNFTLLSTISGGHKRSVRSCAWKPLVKGESVLATASFDATVGVWRRWDGYGRGADDGDRLATSGGPGGYDGDGDSYSNNEEEDDEEWRFAVLLDGHDSEVKSLSWSPAGTLLATCSRDKSIWIWEDLDDGDNNFETVAVMQEHTGDVKWVSWHPTEECLVSASYDDTIRLWREDIDDWGQVACLRGHGGTVWCVEWESGEVERTVPVTMSGAGDGNGAEEALRKEWIEQRTLSGPRLVSCSDDRTIRIWVKQARHPATAKSGPASMPSIIRPADIDEKWLEQSQLPRRHDLSIYSVAWSKRTGLIASTGADGRIVVYQERFVEAQGPEEASPTTNANGNMNSDTDAPSPPADVGSIEKNGDNARAEEQARTRPGPTATPQTEWHVLAMIDAAHGIYEVNHVCWALRADKGRKEGEEEEVLISTGDGGDVKVWRLER
ncbi:WD40 repeat-containing protein [Histoplasma capsulatum var. duboisii H88]|uniref:Probable cytosolic iron-sulfur protein assembly protein 1 n=1 Tax=Ajellomyces capsulatus (strain H88) TaxID=544711 RepID=F0US93_AJEC8|nr:WD40 repeat-containing protein [Histoplasma capsulatum var. duboisii H88]QSS54369.1 WD domain-containing protein [Histoplasma capsulatum var. duboisii H88]